MLRSFWLRIRKRRQLDRDLRDELDFHLEMRQGDARAPFGNATAIREEMRDMWSFVHVENLWRDVRHAARVLGRAPGHTAAIVLLLAVGIGANAAIFTLFNAVFIRQLAVERPDELAIVNRTANGGSYGWSLPRLEEFQNRQTSFRGLIAMTSIGSAPALNPDGWGDQPDQPASPSLVSANFFEILGVRAAIGRVFTSADDQPGHPNLVIVLSDGFWRRFLGGDPGIVGRNMYFYGYPFTVVGVTPKEFVGLGESVWVPINTRVVLPGRVTVMGRLEPGISIARAQAEATVLNSQMLAEPDAQEKQNWTYGVRIDPGSRGLGRLEIQYGRSLQVLMGAVALLLLLASANVGSLLLARAGSRQRETAVRLALGCGRARLIRQFLVESLILSIGGCVIGLAFASWAARGLAAVIIPAEVLPVDVSLDATVLLYTLGASCIAAILFGLGPALRASSVGIEQSLKNASQTSTGPRSRHLLNRCFAAAQVALSVVLVAGSALFGRSLYQIYSTAGFSAKNVLTVTFFKPDGWSSEAQSADLARRLTERIEALPRVKSVSIVSNGIMNGWNYNFTVSVASATAATGPPHAETVSANFLDALEIPVIAGRGFQKEDRKGSPLVAVVNQTFARFFFPGEDPLGKNFGVGPNASIPVTIVGMVRDARYEQLRQSPLPIAFAPFEQSPSPFYTVLIKTTGSPAAVMPLLRPAFLDVIRKMRFFRVQTLDESLGRSISRDILLAQFTGFFGALALGIACFGVYGIISYLVVSKTTEIGIRLAVGAQPGRMLRRVIGDALLTVAPGVVLGIAIAMGAEQSIAALLFGFKSHDPVVYASVASCLLLTTALAAYLPARRASKIDPVDALRCE